MWPGCVIYLTVDSECFTTQGEIDAEVFWCLCGSDAFSFAHVWLIAIIDNLNRIVQMWSKLKANLHRAEPPIPEALVHANGVALEKITKNNTRD